MILHDQPTNADRRVFIKGLGFVSLGLVTSVLLGGCETLIESIRNRPVRRRLRTGSPEVDDAIAIYRDAVQKMQALSAGNGRSWSAQAAIHGTVSSGFNLCQHGTPHFFSWHRAYLFYFEKICQELTGEKKFGLPYWNWNRDPAIHPAFTMAGSPLNHPRTNTTVAGISAFNNATMNTIFADTNFLTFSSQLEGTPHNTAHVVIGMDMAGGGSAIDPLFWVHHCMVDYAWSKWNLELGNDNPGDTGWINTSWNHFVDGQGNPATVSAGITTLMPLLSYRYETSAVGGFAVDFDLAALGVAEFRDLEARVRRGADVRFDVRQRVPVATGGAFTIARPSTFTVRATVDQFTTLLQSNASAERIFLAVDFAELPMRNDFLVRVFVDLPAANVQTSTDDAHYAGAFAFFGTHSGRHDEHPHKTDFLVDVTPTLQRLKASGALRPDRPISVQLVAVPVARQFANPDLQVPLKDIALVVTPVHIRTQDRR